MRDDNVDEVDRMHGPGANGVEIVASATSRARDQFKRRPDLYRREDKTEQRAYYNYPRYLQRGLPPLFGFHHMPKPQTSDQPHAALKCERLERRSLEAQKCPDRKSTRLNSSHQIISYAVFCLKKKKKKNKK